MYNNTAFYKKVIDAWQAADDRRDAHNRYCKTLLKGRDSEPSYKQFMGWIRYLRYEKSIKLMKLALPHTDWDELREYASEKS